MWNYMTFISTQQRWDEFWDLRRVCCSVSIIFRRHRKHWSREEPLPFKPSILLNYVNRYTPETSKLFVESSFQNHTLPHFNSVEKVVLITVKMRRSPYVCALRVIYITNSNAFSCMANITPDGAFPATSYKYLLCSSGPTDFLHNSALSSNREKALSGQNQKATEKIEMKVKHERGKNVSLGTFGSK